MCLDCLMTVATSIENDIDLEILEVRHMCPEKLLGQLLARRHAAEAQASKN